MDEGRAPLGHLRPAQPGPVHERQVGAGEGVVVGEACGVRPEVEPRVRERVAAALAQVPRHLPLVLATRAHLHAAVLPVRASPRAALRVGARSPDGRMPVRARLCRAMAHVRRTLVDKAREVEIGPAGRRRSERPVRGERAPEAVHVG